MDLPILGLVTFLPLAGAAVVFLMPAAAARVTALVVSLATFAISIPAGVAFDPLRTDAFQLVEGPIPWVEDLGISYYVGIDGIALVLVLLTTFLQPIVVFASFSQVKQREPLYYGFLLLLETGMVGAFVSLDTFLFYVFWELMLIPMYFLIGIWGGKNRIYATIKFFVFTMAGSLLMLVAILALYAFHHEQFGAWSAALPDLYRLDLPYRTELWLFAAFAVAFAVKVPMFPVHTWLPDAHVEAPTGGSVILAGVLLKLGTFGFVRYAMPLFPEATMAAAPCMIALAVVGIVYGALAAMAQDDVKKLVAYSSVSHMGAVMLGLFAFNAEGVSGAVYQMLNHGLSTGALFLMVGILYERRHTRLIAEYGGLARSVPLISTAFLLVTLSSIGLPGLNGFVGEVLILLGAFERWPVATAIGATGVVLGALYMLWLVQRVFFGPLSNQENRDLPDLTLREAAYLAPIAVLFVVMGLWPQPILDVVRPSVETLIGPFQEAIAQGGGP